ALGLGPPGREDHEVTQVMLATASLHPQELASLLEPQTGRKTVRTHPKPCLSSESSNRSHDPRPGDSPGDRSRRAGPSSSGSLAAGGGPEPLATPATAGRDDLATVAGGHPCSEAVSAGPAEVVGLVSSLGHVRVPAAKPPW